MHCAPMFVVPLQGQANDRAPQHHSMLPSTDGFGNMHACRHYNVSGPEYAGMVQGVKEAYHSLNGRAVLRGVIFVQV